MPKVVENSVNCLKVVLFTFKVLLHVTNWNILFVQEFSCINWLHDYHNLWSVKRLLHEGKCQWKQEIWASIEMYFVAPIVATLSCFFKFWISKRSIALLLNIGHWFSSVFSMLVLSSIFDLKPNHEMNK